jgi:hypothetical protein
VEHASRVSFSCVTQAFPSPASLLSLAAAANGVTVLNSLHSSSTALTLLSDAAAPLTAATATRTPHNDAAATGGCGDSSVGGEGRQLCGTASLSITPLVAVPPPTAALAPLPAAVVTSTPAASSLQASPDLAKKGSAGGGAPMPFNGSIQAGPVTRMRKAGSTTSLQGLVPEGGGGGARGATATPPPQLPVLSSAREHAASTALAQLHSVAHHLIGPGTGGLAGSRHASMQDLASLDGSTRGGAASGRRTPSNRGGMRNSRSVGGHVSLDGMGSGGGGMHRISSLQALVEVRASHV